MPLRVPARILRRPFRACEAIMTPETCPDQPNAATVPEDAADNDTAATPSAAIPAFRFPFSPATFAPGKSDSQPWHRKGSTSGHEKKIGPAPNGTRRSMGKR